MHNLQPGGYKTIRTLHIKDHMENYPFSLIPETYQPSGHVNYSRLERQYLDFEPQLPLTEITFYDKNNEATMSARQCIHLVRWLKSLPHYMRKHLIQDIMTLCGETGSMMKMLSILEWTINLEHQVSAESLFVKVYVMERTKFHSEMKTMKIWATSYNAMRWMDGGGVAGPLYSI